MALNWKPHTQPPVFDSPTSILVALPAVDGEPAIVVGLYNAFHGDVTCEVDGMPIDGPYFWVTEDELLEGLP